MRKNTGGGGRYCNQKNPRVSSQSAPITANSNSEEQLKGHLRDWNFQVLDLGTNSTEAVDYPDFAEAVGKAVASGQAWLGIVLDSAGIGSSIATNKVPGSARSAML